MTLLGGGGLHYDFFHSLYILRLRGFYQGSSEAFLVTIIREGDRGGSCQGRAPRLDNFTLAVLLHSLFNKQLLFPVSEGVYLLKLLKNLS